MEKIDQDWLEGALKKYNEENMISNIMITNSVKATSKGDNYTSEMKRVNMEIILKSGRKMKTSIIIKEIPSTEYTKKVWESMGIFVKEIEVYRSILPNLEDILNEFDVYDGPMWPKCLEFRPYDRLVFEDLSKFGYKMGNRKSGLNFEHCVIVMKSLAKFHAATVILKERGLIDMNTFGTHLYNNENLQDMFHNFQKEAFNRLFQTMESWEPEWKPIADKLRQEVAPNAVQLLREETILDNNKFNVLCHGDCWVNNMLFKYGLDEVTPISVKFVDFQLSFYNSPAFDLKYFLTTSINLDVRNNSLTNKLIEIYHETLIKQLKYYNYDGNIITIDTLHQELNRIGFFGLMVAMNVLPIITLEDVNALSDLEDVFKEIANGGERKAEFNPFVNTAPTFIRIIKSTIKNYVDKYL